MWTVFWILLSVASNGVVGAVDDFPEECPVCLNEKCRTVSGLYTKPEMPPGYTLIAQIPQGACRIIVQQLKHTRNYIALRNAPNGSFVVNGDWRFSPSRTYEAAGTRFVYQKQDAEVLETVTAAGPLANAVDILIVYQQPNPGIKYGYAVSENTVEQIAPPYLKLPPPPSVPKELPSVGLESRRLDYPNVTQRDEAQPPPPISHHRRRIRRRFAWKISGVSACSKSCGGGTQTTLYTCVREHTHTAVSEKRCVHVERPLPQQIRCNTQPCSALWGGTWGSCAGSCGQGVQTFVVQCQQDVNDLMVVVSDVACARPKPIASSRPCKLPPCENDVDNEVHQNPSAHIDVQEWKVGPWSQCSVSCGTGQRSRLVSCPTGRCSPENRPSHAEYCDSGSCAVVGQQISPWLVSEWSQCSESCGTGTQSRLAVCTRNSCETQPETTRACSSDRYCVGQWFVGPWGACSDACNGSAKQVREVVCIVKVRGQSRITTDMTCPPQDKPETERSCQGSCSPKWVIGEWGPCEGSCPTGAQRREIRCVEANGAPSKACTDEERPVTKRPCICERKEDHANKLAHDEPQNRNCVDKFANCYLAVQARLCQYAYYKSNCCQSCSKAQDVKQ